ncbi:hypothetical protein scyTo_0001480 [Scyliorhinus torazame]|uniref:Uncharacterized protein n=1 Tax=Scyliorhinus torazame TaxID=75743 RepID=A0A401PDH2_SCYTO|nr:hypothetical protein [Scyliorhinus torazame]
MIRSSESTSIVNSLQENDILEKLTLVEEHQELNNISDHPKETDITKLNDTSDHTKRPDITKFKDTPDNTKDTVTKMFKNESAKTRGTDLEHTKSDYGTTECTQRYGCETKGQLNNTLQFNDKKVFELAVTLDKPYSMESNTDGIRATDCKTVCGKTATIRDKTDKCVYRQYKVHA